MLYVVEYGLAWREYWRDRGEHPHFALCSLPGLSVARECSTLVEQVDSTQVNCGGGECQILLHARCVDRAHPTPHTPLIHWTLRAISPHRVGMDVRAHMIGKPRAVQQLGVPFGMLAAI